MGRARGYRRFAGHCLEIAQSTTDPQTKAVMVLMAQIWSRLADELDPLAQDVGGDETSDEADDTDRS